MKKKFISILLTAAMLVLCACGGPGSEPKEPENKIEESGSEGQEDGTGHTDPSSQRTVTDPSGAEITLPEQINSIVVLAPSLSELVAALGMGDKVIGYDSYSIGLEGLPKDAPTFDDITNPDMEQLAALNPDILLISNETLYDQESPYQSLVEAGTCVARIPNSDDIADIKSDIQFLATALNASEAGSSLIDGFEKQLGELAAIAAKIPQEERKRVYFEVAPAPNMYSFGNGVFLDEMIKWIGAENILSGQSGWFTVEGETIVAANPDVIFTNVNYTDDPVQEILSRDGWAGISAVADKNVYSIDSNSSSQPNHNIIKAMRQMAEILYPDYYTTE